MNDYGFGLYVYDLLVHKNFRGKQYGKKLLTHLKAQFSVIPVYVLSDVDEYYHKQDYQKIGSVFEITK